MHHVALDRAWPDDRDFDDQVVEIARLQAWQHRNLRPRFDLEHAHGVAPADHVVDPRILGRDIGHREGTRHARLCPPPAKRAAVLADEIERAADRGQHPQA